MKPQRIEPQLISARQDSEEDKLPKWVVVVGKVAYWLSVVLFFKAFVDAVG